MVEVKKDHTIIGPKIIETDFSELISRLSGGLPDEVVNQSGVRMQWPETLVNPTISTEDFDSTDLSQSSQLPSNGIVFASEAQELVPLAVNETIDSDVVAAGALTVESEPKLNPLKKINTRNIVPLALVTGLAISGFNGKEIGKQVEVINDWARANLLPPYAEMLNEALDWLNQNLGEEVVGGLDGCAPEPSTVEAIGNGATATPVPGAKETAETMYQEAVADEERGAIVTELIEMGEFTEQTGLVGPGFTVDNSVGLDFDLVFVVPIINEETNEVINEDDMFWSRYPGEEFKRATRTWGAIDQEIMDHEGYQGYEVGQVVRGRLDSSRGVPLIVVDMMGENILKAVSFDELTNEYDINNPGLIIGGGKLASPVDLSPQAVELAILLPNDLFSELPEGVKAGGFKDGGVTKEAILDAEGNVLLIKEGDSWVKPAQLEINKQIEGFGYDPSLYRVNGDRLEDAQTGERLGEIRQGNEVVIYEVMEAVSLAQMEARFLEKSNMTMEQRIAELVENNAMFYSRVEQDIEYGAQKEIITEYGSLSVSGVGVLVGTREKYFRDVDKVQTVVELINTTVPENKFFVRVAEKDENGNLVPICWVTDNLHSFDDVNHYSAIHSGYASLEQFFDSIINMKVLVYIPMANTNGNEFQSCRGIMNIPCNDMAEEKGFNIDPLDQIIVSPNGAFRYMSDAETLARFMQGEENEDGNSLARYMAFIEQAKLERLIEEDALVARLVYIE